LRFALIAGILYCSEKSMSGQARIWDGGAAHPIAAESKQSALPAPRVLVVDRDSLHRMIIWSCGGQSKLHPGRCRQSRRSDQARTIGCLRLHHARSVIRSRGRLRFSQPLGRERVQVEDTSGGRSRCCRVPRDAAPCHIARPRCRRSRGQAPRCRHAALCVGAVEDSRRSATRLGAGRRLSRRAVTRPPV
jgi:hypothetical protein